MSHSADRPALLAFIAGEMRLALLFAAAGEIVSGLLILPLVRRCFAPGLLLVLVATILVHGYGLQSRAWRIFPSQTTCPDARTMTNFECLH